MNRMFKVMVVVSLAGLSVVLWTGCGKKAPEIAERTIGKGKDKVTVKGDDKSLTMTMGNGAITAETGKGAKVSADFPKDIPVYPKSEVLMSMKMAENQTFTVQLGTADSLDTVGAYYKKEMAAQGWTESQTMNQGGDRPMQMLVYSKEKEKRTVTVMVASEQGKTTINLQTGTS